MSSQLMKTSSYRRFGMAVLIKKYVVLLFFVGSILAPWVMQAEESGEEDMFSDKETVIKAEEQKNDPNTENVTGKPVGFSGNIAAKFKYDVTRDAFSGNEDLGDAPYQSSIEGDFLLDVRLSKGIKSFADLLATYTPRDYKDKADTKEDTKVDSDDGKFKTLVKEFFVDLNIVRKVYFRFGKQNLRWGKGYLWNPTDLISEDRKNFSDMNAKPEGVFGLKTHVPFGAGLNFYGFANFTGADRVNQFSIAGKVEFLVLEDIEVSLSAWKKKDYTAVYGTDFATYRFYTHWRGEISLSKGDNRHRLEIRDGDFLDVPSKDEWTPRICLGFTKFFEVGNFKDRFSLTGECYYNHGGYDDNMLDEEKTRSTFLEGGYFESGNYGKYYAALFSSFSRFIINDLTLNVDGICNLSDSSFVISMGLDYQLTFDSKITCKLSGYPGEKNGEYSLEGNAVRAEFSVDLSF